MRSALTAAARHAVALSLCAASLPAQSTTRHVRCLESEYDYQLFVPAAAQSSALPAILLLHGAGGTGAEFLEAWRPLAARERVALVAPQIPRTIAFESIAPAVFRCMMEDAKHSAPLDTARIYVFGYSMGGYLTYDAAMLASRYFAGAGVYAAAIADDFTSIVDSAQRKIPMALYIGTRDRFYSTNQVKRTRDLLASHGFPVRYLELEGQDHSFDPVAERVTRDAWKYLSAFRLTTP